ncbi:MAG: hypothetical protein QGG40_17505, partial [Myxococcota bacterium]|nr:hypothetical protein [Myxococcota bacterium]
GHRITIGSARLESDILVAPTVELASETGGKVKIIDCYNELGSNAVKGGLSIEDLDELLGDADGFLQQRGVTRLPGSPEGTADPAP